MRRHLFEAHLDKIFDWTDLVKSMVEGRRNPLHPWKKVFDAVFLGSACQFGTVHRIEAECNSGVFEKRIGPLSEDTIGYALQRQSAQEVFDLGCQVVKQLKRNGVFRSDWSRGRVVAAVDGIEICSSYSRCCDSCLERNVERNVDGQVRKCIQYYHKISAVTLVSTPFPVFLGIRFQQPGEDEVACSLALLRELVANLGKRFIDILVADALYLQNPFTRAIELLGLDWVINLKGNQPNLAAEAERLTTNRPAGYSDTGAKEDLQLWHLPQVDWPVADRLIGIVKTVRTIKANQVVVEKIDGRLVRKKTSAPKIGTDFYATNIELGAIPALFIHQLGRSRWVIDAQAFQTITTNCNLKLPPVHKDTALVVLTMIRVLAYTLSMVFYHRQVRSHFRTAPPSFCEMARQLGYRFLALQFNSG